MLKHITQLHSIATSEERLIVGLMSGTSLDGLDIAVCRISGNGKSTQVICERFKTIEYTEAIKESIQQVFAKQNVSLDALCLLNADVGRLHGEMVKQALIEWNIPLNSVDLIASHGQTIYHRPTSLHNTLNGVNSTLQIGDGDHIAVVTGIITLSDFRQKHIAYGGEGAPLVMYGDYLLLGSDDETRVLLNIGGIANLTYLPANATFDEVICADIGPGNTIMDALVRTHTGNSFDKDAKLAKQGTIHPPLLARLMQHPYLTLAMPKTTGPESFNLKWLMSQLHDLQLSALPLADQMATLNAFSAHCIADTINSLPASSSVYLSGGGAHNPLLTETLCKLLERPLYSTNDLGVNMDAKEAILFAVLANECVAGSEHTFLAPHTEKNKPNQPNMSMGKLSFP